MTGMPCRRATSATVSHALTSFQGTEFDGENSAQAKAVFSAMNRKDAAFRKILQPIDALSNLM